MSIPRFFVEENVGVGDKVSLENEAAHHLIYSLRIKKNESLIIVDPSGNQYLCNIKNITRRRVVVQATEQLRNNPESPVDVTLGISLLSASKLETIMRHATELGINTIIPFQAERSQLKCHQVTKKRKRWMEIVKSASQQSGRTKIPDVSEPLLLDDILEMNNFSLKLVSWEKELSKSVAELHGLHPNAEKLLLLVGPEGGFTEQEIAKCIEKGFLTFTLGPRILRTETATIAAIALIQHFWGDLGIFS